MVEITEEQAFMLITGMFENMERETSKYADILSKDTRIFMDKEVGIFVRRLLSGDINKSDKYNRALIEDAIIIGLPSLVSLAIEKGATYDVNDPLLLANAAIHSVDCIPALLKLGYSINMTYEGRTVLMGALTSDYIIPGDIQKLIEFGADVNACDNDGVSVLSYAINGLNEEYWFSKFLLENVKILLENGANANIRDKNGRSVLDRYDAIDADELKDIDPTGKVRELLVSAMNGST